jgi:hypothetical protein
MPKLLLFVFTVSIFGSSLSAQGRDVQKKSESQDVACRCYRSGNWIIQQTDSFRILTQDPNLNLNKLPTLCERLKTKIQGVWLDKEAESWQPRCDVVVHATLANYRQTLGVGVGNSVGCATMQYNGGRVVSRRIDIRIDADHWQSDALPHEMTHVVLSDRFGARRLPAWIDEGIGVLAESDQKRQLRVKAFGAARERGTIYTVPRLVNLREFPDPQYRDAFYVQSAAIVRLLIEQEDPQDFIRFTDLVIDAGLDQALREVFNLDGLPALSALVEKTDASSLLMSSNREEAKRELVADRDE